MPFDEWIIVNHPKSRRPAAAVLLRDTSFVAYIPLLDARDSDGDGTVSWGEAATCWVPIVGDLKRGAEIGNMMQIIAMDSRVLDVNLYGQGQQQTLSALLVAVEQSITSVYLGLLIGEAAGLALAGTRLTGISYYVVKKGCEKVIEKAFQRATGFGTPRS